MKTLGSFTISAEDSLGFAHASGDFNPLHLDSIAARRTQFGLTLIHGVCGTLQALELMLQAHPQDCSLKNIRVKYIKPVTQGQELNVKLDLASPKARLEVFAGHVRSQIIDLEFSGAALPDAAMAVLAEEAAQGNDCSLRSIEDCENLAESVTMVWQQAAMEKLFPNATRYLPQTQLATLLASTNIVGMHCPGLHSVFAGLEIDFSNSKADGYESELHYRVTATDKRIEQVQLDIGNAYATGSIEAFFRAPPAQQASYEQIVSLVKGSEFSGQTALVVGASRGLGEVIAKVLCAGGADVTITYASGEADAQRVAEDIGQRGNQPRIAHFDATAPKASAALDQALGSCTHIYYLASPTISKGEPRQWDAILFSRFCDFYIHGLAALLQLTGEQASSAASEQRHLFVPSSVFLEEKVKGFNEYIAAKTAAEAYAARFASSNSDWQVAAPRLPRLHSDQTSGVRGTSEEKNLEVIIATLRECFG